MRTTGLRDGSRRLHDVLRDWEEFLKHRQRQIKRPHAKAVSTPVASSDGNKPSLGRHFWLVGWEDMMSYEYSSDADLVFLDAGCNPCRPQHRRHQTQGIRTTFASFGCVKRVSIIPCSV